MFVGNIFLFLQFIFISTYVSEGSVQFLFYKNDNETIEIQNEDLNDLNINVQKPVKILIHGLAANSSTDWYKLIKSAYLALDYHVFAVDMTLNAFSGYLKAISTSRHVGSTIGKFVVDLSNICDIPYQNMHILGHSLGAHVAGFAGKFILQNSTQKIGRITGLDPAGPLHNYLPSTKRLSDEDADLVDIIHTNAGVLGIIPSIGHMDFYPDGGENQNICEINEFQCNHNMAPQYFIESINEHRFEAVLCDSYENYTLGLCDDNVKSFMGENCQLKEKGDYFLTISVLV